jgi:peptide/nickel transport system substrate-binding protein
MFWDQNVPTVQLAGMVAAKDPDLTIGPDGNNYIVMNPYLSINLQSPNNHGALKNLKVRQALEYAINKYADSQVYGGAVISGVANQAVPPGSVGYIPGYDPYPSADGQGNPAKAKQLLAAAGYKPGQITLKLVYRTNTVHPQIAENDQAALEAAGFKVDLIAVTPPNAFYTKYLENPPGTSSRPAGSPTGWGSTGAPRYSRFSTAPLTGPSPTTTATTTARSSTPTLPRPSPPPRRPGRSRTGRPPTARS